MKGYLLQLVGTLFKKWEERYYCLEGDKIFFYSSKDELEHVDYIALSKVEKIVKNPNDQEDESLLIEADRKNYIIKTLNPNDLPALKKGIQNWSEYFILKRMQNMDSGEIQKSIRMKNLSESNPPHQFEEFQDNQDKELIEIELEWIIDVLGDQEKSMLSSLKKIDVIRSDAHSLKQAIELNQIPEKKNTHRFLEEIKREFHLIQKEIFSLLPKKVKNQEKMDFSQVENNEDLKSLSIHKKIGSLKMINNSNEKEIEDLKKKLFFSYLNNFTLKKNLSLDEENMYNRALHSQIKSENFENWIKENFKTFEKKK